MRSVHCRSKEGDTYGTREQRQCRRPGDGFFAADCTATPSVPRTTATPSGRWRRRARPHASSEISFHVIRSALGVLDSPHPPAHVCERAQLAGCVQPMGWTQSHHVPNPWAGERIYVSRRHPRAGWLRATAHGLDMGCAACPTHGRERDYAIRFRDAAPACPTHGRERDDVIRLGTWVRASRGAPPMGWTQGAPGVQPIGGREIC